MSPQIRPLIAGLAAPGLLWLATSVALGQAAPAPRGLPNPAPTSPATYQALLLSSGQVVRGEIVEDAAAGVFRHRQKVGTVQYPRAMVQKAAGSVEELYRFQAARLPAGDPDERMKLARWCLTEHLPDQAREQLVAVQRMSPDDREVRRMLFNLDATASRPGVDPEIRRTSAEQPAAEQPAALDPRFLASVSKHFNTVPVIFDLPPAQAVRRADEFARYVQPVLLQSCAKCHNEKYQGTFQLVEIRTQRDLKNPDVARANLDAALRLVNPDDPSRSDLLSAGLVPHGGSKNAIFRGPNDRYYQPLATWVKSLKPAAAAGRGSAGDVSRAGYAPADASSGEGFGADRATGPRSAAPAPFPLPRTASNPAVPNFPDMAAVAEAAAATPPPSKRIVQRFQEDAEFRLKADDNPEFPVPFAAGGVQPTRPATRPARPAQPGAEAPKPASPPAIPPKAATPIGRDAVAVEPTDTPNQLPGMNQPLYPTAPAAGADDEGEPRPARKKEKKIDNALLEKLMKNRNANP